MIYDIDYGDLETRLTALGASREQARAVWRALYREAISTPEQTPELPEDARAVLANELSGALPALQASVAASDGAARKDLLQLSDGETIELVLMRYRHRHSACISTQVGCACGCVFCATGQMGFVRQLTSGEIVTQVMHAQRTLMAQGESLSNFVLMGMGEPLLNYENVLAAVRRLCDPRGLGFVERRITLSTAGIVPGIVRLADEGLRINLAVSLHAASDDVRSELMPINRRYPLADLWEALRYYTQKTQRRVMLEWVMIAGVNDDAHQAEALVTWLAGVPAHVNLILLNPTGDFPAQPAVPETVELFTTVLDRASIPHTVRQRRGGSIAAGCGQLRQQ
ncbi:MAG: 23S rRNA (adenine(2503)-C(2))-methyltransferase RlmN [Anaerolineae bacterium]|nr:23S rRNA (adenine(2503)-C(2))-methyltransferase RlmN [Anaerolineae bacterium]